MLRKLIQKFKITKQTFIAIFIALTVIVYFSSYTIFGDKGVLKYFQLRKELRTSNSIKESLSKKIEDKKNLVKGMSANSLDIDLLDEQARKSLGHANKGEIVVYED